MCRNIKKLRRPDASPTDAELADAALQYVRKISGFNSPSQVNRKAFEKAVRDITRASRTLFEGLEANRRQTTSTAA